MKPLIGLTTRPKDENSRYALASQYLDSVRRAGGIPVLLTPGEKPEEILSKLDGIILTGGGDIAPELYHGKPHSTIYGVDQERDLFEIDLAKAIVKSTLPGLFICRGAQILNVALGGNLMEHLPDEVGNSITHRDPEQKVGVAHPVSIEPGSKLHNICGPQCEIISWHHQALKDVPDELSISALASDGIIEAVEHKTHPWLVAVQWHPELSADTDPIQQKLFNAFVERCKHT